MMSCRALGASRTFRSGALAVVIEPVDSVITMAAVLDDRAGELTEGHADSGGCGCVCRTLALRDWPTTITTLSRVTKGAAPVLEHPTERPELSEPWNAVYE